MTMPRFARMTQLLADWHIGRHTVALRRRFPRLDQPLASAVRDELAAAHATYTRLVSRADMAASFETATLLWRLCDTLRPTRLMDTGSGFSSFVLRRWAADQPDAAVWSLDDDAQWLERTRAFLNEHGLSDRGLMLWDAFASGTDDGFDLVFHDLGTMATRLTTLPTILRRARPGSGVVVLDDTHNAAYAAAARTAVKRHRAVAFDARNWTLDPYRRHATIVCDVAA